MSDDITFCNAYCDNLSCRRNMANIQDWSKAHSWMLMEDVPDCPLDSRKMAVKPKVHCMEARELWGKKFKYGVFWCGECGAHLEATAKYCSGCGRRIDWDAVRDTPGLPGSNEEEEDDRQGESDKAN